MDANMKFHEAANIFPLMDGEDLDALVNDIRAHGLQEPIKLLDGLILDGRNRHTACLLAGVAPQFEDVETGDPVAYVLSHNLHRRHLTPSQRSLVAARVREHYDAAAKERQKLAGGDHKSASGNVTTSASGKARDQAGKAVGVSGKLVDHATKVLKQGTPELVKAVDDGRMAVRTAAILATEPEEYQRETLENGRHNRRYLPNPYGARDTQPVEEEVKPAGEVRGVGVARANEAINCLIRIPKNDALRKRGFQIVTDWIKANR